MSGAPQIPSLAPRSGADDAQFQEELVICGIFLRTDTPVGQLYEPMSVDLISSL